MEEAIPGQLNGEQAQPFSTVRTKGTGRGRRRAQINQEGRTGLSGNQQPDHFKGHGTGGAQEAVVADFLKALRQQMIEKTADELYDFQVDPACLSRLFVAKAESDHSLLARKQAAVGNGHPEHIATQILQGMDTIPCGLAMNNPVLLLDLGGDLIQQLGFFHFRSELGAKYGRDSLHGQEEFIRSGQPAFPVGTHSTTRDQIVQVRVILKLSSPGVEHSGQAHQVGPEEPGIAG
jgi:hypothetical protein